MHSRVGVAALLVVSGACATRVPVEGRQAQAGTYPTAAELELPRCEADRPELEGRTAEWREVTANGFRYCVPGSWRRLPLDEWESEGGSFRVGDLVDASRPLIPGYRLRSQERTVDRAEIGGFTAVIVEWRSEDLREPPYGTLAQWEEPRVYLRGVARSREAMRLQQLVFYTVRFDREM